MSLDITLPVLEIIKRRICAERLHDPRLDVSSYAWLVYHDNVYRTQMLERSSMDQVRVVKRIMLDEPDHFRRWEVDHDGMLVISIDVNSCEVWNRVYPSYNFSKDFCWTCNKSRAKITCEQCGIAHYCNLHCMGLADHHSLVCNAPVVRNMGLVDHHSPVVDHHYPVVRNMGLADHHSPVVRNMYSPDSNPFAVAYPLDDLSKSTPLHPVLEETDSSATTSSFSACWIEPEYALDNVPIQRIDSHKTPILHRSVDSDEVLGNYAIRRSYSYTDPVHSKSGRPSRGREYGTREHSNESHSGHHHHGRPHPSSSPSSPRDSGRGKSRFSVSKF